MPTPDGGTMMMSDTGMSQDSGPQQGCSQSGKKNCSMDMKSVETCGSDFKLATTPCAFGCSETGSVHCKRIIATGAASVVDSSMATAAVDLMAPTSFDTDTGAITGGLVRGAGMGIIAGIGYQQLAQTSAPGIGAFTFKSFHLGAGKTVTFTGVRAAVFVVEESASIEGTISLRGTCGTNKPGPGGFPGGVATAQTVANGGGPLGGVGGANGPNCMDGNPGGSCGGGGAGGYTVGGSSGIAGRPYSGSNMTYQRCTAASGGPKAMPFGVDGLVIGGSGGGAGLRAAGGPSNGNGGAGGGALQLIVNGPVSIAGALDSGGCGGGVGGDQPQRVSAGGGGAGGLIVVEAATIDLKTGAKLVANGGGGGGGNAINGTGMMLGADGTSDGTAALGGTGSTCPKGGNGGAQTAAANVTGGCDRPFADYFGPQSSGGGGAGGRIALRTQTGMSMMGMGSIISPANEPGTVSSK